MRLRATSQQDRALSAFLKSTLSDEANQLQTIKLKSACTLKIFVPNRYAKVTMEPKNPSQVE
jgi:hypothetical protein